MSASSSAAGNTSPATKREASFRSYFLNYAREHGKWPTLQDLADCFRISISAVQKQLTRMQAKGLVEQTKVQSHRGWKIPGYRFELVEVAPAAETLQI